MGTQQGLGTWGRQGGVDSWCRLVTRSKPCSGRSNRGTHQLLVPGPGGRLGLLHKVASSLLPHKTQVASSCPPGSGSGEAAREQTQQRVDDPSWCSSARPGTGVGGEQKPPEELITALV